MSKAIVTTNQVEMNAVKRAPSFNKIASQWKATFALYLSEHPDENLLFVLHRVALDDKNSPLTRVKAATECLKFMTPQLMQIEVDAPDVAVLEEVSQLKTTIRSLLKKDDD